MLLAHLFVSTVTRSELESGGQITLFQIFAGSVLIALVITFAIFLVRVRKTGNRRLTAKTSMRLLASVASATGFLMLLEAGVTLAWQEPFSALIGRHNQRALQAKLRIDEHPERVDQATARRLTPQLAKKFRNEVKVGDAAGTISIPKLNIKFALVYGTDTQSLKKGPGMFSTQPLPGMLGTAAIAGHRTTYLAPFRNIDNLSRGDDVVVVMPYAKFEYEVESSESVQPTQVSVLNDHGYERIVLSACDPPFSTARRLVVSSNLKHITIFKKQN